MNVTRELKIFILSPQVTSKQPHKIVKRLIGLSCSLDPATNSEFLSSRKFRMIMYDQTLVLIGLIIFEFRYWI